MPQAYRLLSYDLENLQVLSPVVHKPVDVTPGRIFNPVNGLVIYRDKDDTSHLPSTPEWPLVLLTFEYEDNDLISPAHSAEPSLAVHRATLKAVEFQDPEVQHRFAHLLAPEITQERRVSSRKESLLAFKGRGTYAIVRAMDARSKHTHPMDYVYICEPGVLKGVAQAVVTAYEQEEKVRTILQRAVLKALEHAVTTAIYEEAPQHVTFALVSTRDVYRAPNEGEFFYDAPAPLKMQSLILVNERGEVSLPDAVVAQKPDGGYSAGI